MPLQRSHRELRQSNSNDIKSNPRPKVKPRSKGSRNYSPHSSHTVELATLSAGSDTNKGDEVSTVLKNLDRRFNDLATLRRDLDEITSIILVKKRIFDIIGSMQSDRINCERMIASLSNTKTMREKQLKV